MGKRIGIVIICTNCYFILGLRFIKKFDKYYKGNYDITYCIFTDTDPAPYLIGINNYLYFHNSHNKWCDATNSKFQNILLLKESGLDYIFFFDADTNIHREFNDWFIGDIVGGEHFNNIDMIRNCHFNYEHNELSVAYIPKILI